MDTSAGFIIDFVLCLFPKRGSGGMQKANIYLFLPVISCCVFVTWIYLDTKIWTKSSKVFHVDKKKAVKMVRTTPLLWPRDKPPGFFFFFFFLALYKPVLDESECDW